MRSNRDIIDFMSEDMLLVDETSSDSSVESSLIDPKDISAVLDGRKPECEKRLLRLYKAFRISDGDYAVRKKYGFDIVNEEFVDVVSENAQIVFDRKKIETAVNLFHNQKVNIKEGAEKMHVSVFGFVALLMDYIWIEREKTALNFSIMPIVKYLDVDCAHLRILGLLVTADTLLRPSEIARRTLCEPLELVVMITMLLAKLYKWPVACDFEDKKWRENLWENPPVSPDDVFAESMSDFQDVARDVFSPLNYSTGSSSNDELREFNTDNLVNLADELSTCAVSLIHEMDELPSVEEVVHRAEFLSSSICQEADASIEENELTRGFLIIDPQEEQPHAVAPAEEISVVCVAKKDSPISTNIIDEDPVRLCAIPCGSFVLARRRAAMNFTRCQIIRKVTAEEYEVQFDDGSAEIVDISRIARRFEDQLKMWEGVRVCALYEPRLKNDRVTKAFYSGVVGVGPHTFSTNEMLVFFDNGADGVVQERTVYILMEQKFINLSGKQVIDRRSNWTLLPKHRQIFIKHYMNCYPDWPLVPMKRRKNTQRVNILRDGKPHSAYVLDVERQFALLRFPIRGHPGSDCVIASCVRHKHIDEWVYRGTDRLNAIGQTIARLEKIERQSRSGLSAGLTRSRRETRLGNNLEYAIPLQKRDFTNEELASISQENLSDLSELCPRGQALFKDDEQAFQRRQTARKGKPVTTSTRENFGKFYAVVRKAQGERREIYTRTLSFPDWCSKLRQKKHFGCFLECLQGYDRDPFCEEFKGCSPYIIPLRTGWSREIVNFSRRVKLFGSRQRVKNTVVYRTPCGIFMYQMKSIAKYLRDTCSLLTIDLFTFDSEIRPEVVVQTPSKYKILDDFTNGREAIPIPVYNEVDGELPPEIEYYSHRYPFDESTNLSTLSADYCTGCSCTGDCADEEFCECRRLTCNEVQRLDKSLQPTFSRGYKYRNLALGKNGDEVFLSGLYECNDRCKCNRSTCHNRVVQQQIKVPMELFKTERMGWGVRTIVDLPAGVFLCVYAGAILTDSQAETQGKLNGDEYFADVNLVENVEREKHNAGVDIDDAVDGYYTDDGSRNSPVSEESDHNVLSLNVGYDSGQDSDLSSDGSISNEVLCNRRSKRRCGSTSQATVDRKSQDLSSQASDLDYVKSSLIIAEPDIYADERDDGPRNGDNEMDDQLITSITEPPEGHFDMLKYIEKEALPSLYTIDAKNRGNIGRFFNHSCEPNIRTQHVFVDTHDLRLPWIAFFTKTKVLAGMELCWDYGYSEGAVDGKQLVCHCGSKYCRKRLL